MNKPSAPNTPSTPNAASTALPPGLRRFLYFTAAVTGGAIMIIEILGAKMLAPYVGTSHFVWIAQITVTLLALAGGYQLGGWLVDRSQELRRLYAAIAIAAVYLFGCVMAVEPIAYRCLALPHVSFAQGSLLASGALFFVPLALLAMTGPFLVRALTVSVNGVGGSVGRLTAVSTVGSVAGTLLIGYLLVPLLPNSRIMYLTASILLALPILYTLGWDRRARAVPVTAVIVGGLLGAAGDARASHAAPGDLTEIYRANSHFGQLQVMDLTNSARRYYLNDFLIQNTFDSTTRQSVSMFTYMLHGLARAYAPKTDDVLCIGLGVGIVPMKFAREGSRVEVVEINPAVIPLAQKHFDLQPEKLNLHIGDGRTFLHHVTRPYDAIVLDAFLGDSSPSHLLTREAFLSMSRALQPEGVLVINSFCDFSPDADFLGTSLNQTLKAVFKNVLVHAAGNGNVFFVASNRPELTILHPPNLAAVPDSVRNLVESAFNTLANVDGTKGLVLTDDFNPVEFRDAKNRERMRRALAFSMRQ